MPHALESGHVIDLPEGGTPLILPKSFFFSYFPIGKCLFPFVSSLELSTLDPTSLHHE
jgi:hypothetical protein